MKETIEAAVDRSRPLELPPLPGVDYRMAIDASGGAAGGDVYAASIAHREGEAVVIDVVRGVAGKFDPVRLTRDFAALAKAYGIATVTGDRYAPQWVASAWAECGIVYETSALSQSAVYLEAVPLFARCLARLPNHARLLRELSLLERRTQRNGRDVVDHRPGESDDYAAAVCGALVLASTARPSLWSRQSFGAPATIPHLAQIVFAVLVANSREIAACLFALTRDRTLYVVDTCIDPPSPQLFDNVLARLIDLKRTTCAECAVIFASSPMVAEFAKRAQPAHVIDDLFREGSDALALGAALHISQGRVRIADEARSRRDPLATYGSEDALRLAALAGIAIAFDADRTIRSAA